MKENRKTFLLLPFLLMLICFGGKQMEGQRGCACQELMWKNILLFFYYEVSGLSRPNKEIMRVGFSSSLFLLLLLLLLLCAFEMFGSAI